MFSLYMQVSLSDKELPTSKMYFAPQRNANQQQQKKNKYWRNVSRSIKNDMLNDVLIAYDVYFGI